MKTKNLEKIVCPLCKTEKYDIYAEIKGLNYVRCTGCSLVYVNPRLNDSYTQQIYEGKKLKSRFKNFLYSRRTMKDLENIDKRMLRGELLMYEVEKYQKSGKILDIGCNRGFLLAAAESWGWECYGIELVQWMTKLVEKDFNVTIFNKELLEVSRDFEDGFFDAITMIDIIEHLRDPVQNMVEVNRLLKKEGFLLINTVDVESSHARIQGKDWGHLNPFEHLCVFSRRTANVLLEKCGFEIIRFLPSKGSAGEMEIHLKKVKDLY
ncbi:class I SAM-dependent methyltransferase [candidate division KSB1 bacterium]